jgi:glycosyltransferase involved in cell wall biosynthesis
MTNKKNRVFWLGMHIVLTKTELPRLRELGFEVFNPPYNSNVYDQSANQKWEADQPTSLPKAVFKELSEYNFFYNRISSRIARLLNEYFGTIIVTINPDWLEEILKVYHGRIIYRIYGQPYSVSDAMWARRCFRTIQERDNFWLMPHCHETTVDEHDWLKERMRIVPYTLPLDVFDYRDTWRQQEHHVSEIMVSCPNIDNAYYKSYYNYINQYFKQPYIRIYGVQPRQINDRRVVGTIPRNELLKAYQNTAGYLYLYNERNVCYLPPIEMMTVGGPVVYLSGSLLARFFGSNSPGLAVDEYDAQRKLSWLLKGDQSFIDEVIESQKLVRSKYSPEYANPIFDSTFQELIGRESPSPAHPVIFSPHPKLANDFQKVIYVLFHFSGSIIQFRDGQYLSAEGIPRVIRKFVEALLIKTDYQIVITCTAEQLQFNFGFFSANRYHNRLRFLVVDKEEIKPSQTNYTKLILRYIKQTAKNTLRARIPNKLWEVFEPTILGSIRGLVKTQKKSKLIILIKLLLQLARVIFLSLLPLAPVGLFLYKVIKSTIGIINDLVKNTLEGVGILRKINKKLILLRNRLEAINQINTDVRNGLVLIPHYYHFPEAVLLDNQTILYLPDYTPHFFIEKFEGNKDKLNNIIGKALTNRAKSIFTNSSFTKSYLPETLLKVDSSKIHVLPIPLLVPSHQPLDRLRELELKELLDDARYVFYPTQNRPNKQIDFLLQVFAKVQSKVENLKLVLTCNLDHYQPVTKAYQSLDLQESVIFLPGASDAMLSWLYTHASSLCLTSTMEGNFPPQVFEALYFNVPVVATKLPMIVDLLGEASEYLLLCEPLDVDEFTNSLLLALSKPEKVRRKQSLAYKKVLEQCNDDKFYDSVANFIKNLDKNV